MQIPRDDATNRNWLLSDLVAAVEDGSLREAREALRRSFEQKNAACVCWVLGVGCRVLGDGCRVLGVGCQVLQAKSLNLDELLVFPLVPVERHALDEPHVHILLPNIVINFRAGEPNLTDQYDRYQVLQALLEDLADERGDDAATLKLLSYISERAHSEAGAAPCWPRGGLGRDDVIPKSMSLKYEPASEPDLSWLPIVHVSSVRLSPDGSFVEGMVLDEALLLRHLSEHSWCVLRLEVLPGTADGAAVLASALEHARQESGRFFHELPEQRKRELTELPGYSALHLNP